MRLLRICFAAGVTITLLSSCRIFEYELEDSDLIEREGQNKIIRISTDRDTVQANGQDRIELSARIPKEASTRRVTFKTSHGHFLTPEEATKTIAAFAFDDSSSPKYLVARATLIAGTSPARVLVSASILDFVAIDSVVFNKAIVDSTAGGISIMKIDTRAEHSARIGEALDIL